MFVYQHYIRLLKCACTNANWTHSYFHVCVFVISLDWRMQQRHVRALGKKWNENNPSRMAKFAQESEKNSAKIGMVGTYALLC